MLDGFSGESPLHIRLAGELEELKKRLANSSGNNAANGRQKPRMK
jgi:hypothetical protein